MAEVRVQNITSNTATTATSNGKMTSASALICHGWTLVALGIASIIAGIFTSVFAYSAVSFVSAPYWAGVFVLITGVIGVQSGKRSDNPGMTGCFLTMCIFAIFATLIQWIFSAISLGLVNLEFENDEGPTAIHSLSLIIGVIAMIMSFAGSIVSCCHLCNRSQKSQQPQAMVVYVPAPGVLPAGQPMTTGPPGQMIQLLAPNPNGPPGQMQIIQQSAVPGHPQPYVTNTTQGPVTYLPPQQQQFVAQGPGTNQPQQQPVFQAPGPYQPQQQQRQQQQQQQQGPQVQPGPYQSLLPPHSPAAHTPDSPPAYEETQPPAYSPPQPSGEIYEEPDHLRPSVYQSLQPAASASNPAIQTSTPSNPSEKSKTKDVTPKSPRRTPQLPLSASPPSLPPRNVGNQEYYSDTVALSEYSNSPLYRDATGNANGSTPTADPEYIEPIPTTDPSLQGESVQGGAQRNGPIPQSTDQDYSEPSPVSPSTYQSLQPQSKRQ